MKLFLIKCKNFILDILFPPICLHCRKTLNNAERKRNNAENYLCDNCYNSIQLNTSLFCPVCRLRLAENKKICGHTKYLLGAAGNYNDPVLRDLIHYFKYKSFENLSPILGEILLNYLKLLNFETSKLLNFIIVPIPLHYLKEKQRGFNQSKLLAKNISVHFNLEMIDALKRIKNTKPQAQCKNNESRIKNIKNCFKIKESAIESIKNKNVLLIDDVFTTGSTTNEAVQILKQNGVRKIIALVAAKA